MLSYESNSRSLKYQKFPPSGCKDIAIREFEFAVQTQFLCLKTDINLSSGLTFLDVKTRIIVYNMDLKWTIYMHGTNLYSSNINAYILYL